MKEQELLKLRKEALLIPSYAERNVPFKKFLREELPETGGIYRYYEDVPYAYKGHPSPEAQIMTNMIKRFFVSTAKFLKSSKLSAIALAIAPRSFQKKLFESYIDNYLWCHVQMIRWKNDKYCICCREIIRAGEKISYRFEGQHMGYIGKLAHLAANILEFDNAYRWRIQDTFTGLKKKEVLKDVSSGIGEMIYVMGRREEPARRTEKYEDIKSALKLLLFIRRDFKKILYEFLKELNFDKMKLDEGDIYWNLTRTDYNILGLPYKERARRFLEIKESFKRKTDKI